MLDGELFFLLVVVQALHISSTPTFFATSVHKYLAALSDSFSLLVLLAQRKTQPEFAKDS